VKYFILLAQKIIFLPLVLHLVQRACNEILKKTRIGEQNLFENQFHLNNLQTDVMV
jgi:hypothetical protein